MIIKICGEEIIKIVLMHINSDRVLCDIMCRILLSGVLFISYLLWKKIHYVLSSELMFEVALLIG
jgi:hypothetical protein